MENVLKDKRKEYAISIIKLSEFLDQNKNKVISNQILRSGTSIGANIAEAQYAASKLDFANKLQIALKEANETKYWLELIKEMKYIDNTLAGSLLKGIDELIKLLTSSIKTAKMILDEDI